MRYRILLVHFHAVLFNICVTENLVNIILDETFCNLMDVIKKPLRIHDPLYNRQEVRRVWNRLV